MIETYHFLYISQPITDQDWDICRELATYVSHCAIEKGYVPLSPFLLTEAYALRYPETDYEIFMKNDLAIIRALFMSQRLSMIMLEGWKESKGCKQEFELANELNANGLFNKIKIIEDIQDLEELNE